MAWADHRGLADTSTYCKRSITGPLLPNMASRCGRAAQRYLDIVDRAAQQLRETLRRVQPGAVAALLAELRAARRVACYGVGREGLVMKGLAMRLHHTGLQVRLASWEAAGLCLFTQLHALVNGTGPASGAVAN